jgi:ring-1,2-phenylacetyl-CoA epoxidase subunit PaaC
MVRQMLYDAFHLEQMGFLAQQKVDEDLAGIAAKAFKEVQYHWEHSSQWIVRLGDGTEESHDKVQQSLNALWSFTGELFMEDDVDKTGHAAGLLPNLAILQTAWLARVSDCLKEAHLKAPEGLWMQRGGKQGLHSEHLSYLLAEMQTLPRTYPDAVW